MRGMSIPCSILKVLLHKHNCTGECGGINASTGNQRK
jgi:hypothetical protein